MENDFQIVHIAKPDGSVRGPIGRGIGSHNVQHAGDDNYQQICFALQTPDQACDERRQKPWFRAASGSEYGLA